ncbi:uncharacterized protein [Dendrobates tinctorius]|uniref:uncharacterized protein isoform X2 n=1 Tax=Dendrobates tinctorius TaxID=92724 RepID=UPI003CC96CEF
MCPSGGRVGGVRGRLRSVTLLLPAALLLLLFVYCWPGLSALLLLLLCVIAGWALSCSGGRWWRIPEAAGMQRPVQLRRATAQWTPASLLLLMDSYLGKTEPPARDLRERLTRPNPTVPTPARRLSFRETPIVINRTFMSPCRRYPTHQPQSSMPGSLPPVYIDGFPRKPLLSPKHSQMCSPETVKIARPDANIARSPVDDTHETGLSTPVKSGSGNQLEDFNTTSSSKSSAVKSSDNRSSGSRRKKVLLVCLRRDPYPLPPPPIPGYNVTSKDLDNEKKAFLQRLNKALEEPAANTTSALTSQSSTASSNPLLQSLAKMQSKEGSQEPVQTVAADFPNQKGISLGLSPKDVSGENVSLKLVSPQATAATANPMTFGTMNSTQTNSTPAASQFGASKPFSFGGKNNQSCVLCIHKAVPAPAMTFGNSSAAQNSTLGTPGPTENKLSFGIPATPFGQHASHAPINFGTPISSVGSPASTSFDSMLLNWSVESSTSTPRASFTETSSPRTSWWLKRATLRSQISVSQLTNAWRPNSHRIHWNTRLHGS